MIKEATNKHNILKISGLKIDLPITKSTIGLDQHALVSRFLFQTLPSSYTASQRFQRVLLRFSMHVAWKCYELAKFCQPSIPSYQKHYSQSQPLELESNRPRRIVEVLCRELKNISFNYLFNIILSFLFVHVTLDMLFYQVK